MALFLAIAANDLLSTRKVAYSIRCNACVSAFVMESGRRNSRREKTSNLKQKTPLVERKLSILLTHHHLAKPDNTVTSATFDYGAVVATSCRRLYCDPVEQRTAWHDSGRRRGAMDRSSLARWCQLKHCLVYIDSHIVWPFRRTLFHRTVFARLVVSRYGFTPRIIL